MGNVLVCYLITILVIFGGCLGSFAFLGKALKSAVKGGAFFGGMLLSVGYFLGMLLLFRVTFSNEMYYDTPFFRTVVGFVFLILLALVRFLVIKIPFFNRDRVASGHSFSLGFGMAPAAFLGLYSLIMFFVVAFNGMFNGPCIEEAEGLLGFADNTMISIFTPEAGHISFGLLFVAFAFFSLLFSWLIQRISDEPHRALVSFGWGAIMMALEAVMILPVPFIKMYGLPHYALPVIGLICGAVAFLLVRFMPMIQKEGAYIKQFE